MSEFFSVTFSDRCVRLDAFRQCISTNAPLAGCDSLRTNHGYNHNENDSEKGYANLTTTEKKMVLRGLRTYDELYFNHTFRVNCALNHQRLLRQVGLLAAEVFDFIFIAFP